MRKLIQFAVKNPVAICMVVLAVLLLGKISYDRLGVDLMPDLNNPRLFIEMQAGERPPEEIEQQFVKNMESAAIRQNDVTQVSSVIRSGSARITVEYSWGKNMDEAFLDLQKAMNPFMQNENLTELKITQHDPNMAPVVLVGMSHQSITDPAELRKIAENYIRNELIRVEGVAEVGISGQEVSTLTIRTDPYKLEAFGLTVDEIASRIESNNQNVSGGRVSEMGIQYLVKSSTMFGSENDFESLIVGYKSVGSQTAGVSANGVVENAPIFLQEVATVRFENERPENIVRINGERSLGLSVYKEIQYNTVKVVDGVAKQLHSIEQALPGYRFQIISNQGVFIKQAINELQQSALAGIILAVIILYFFLRKFGTTLIVSLAIPISIVATFNLMFFGGLTLNIMTLGGLALGAGMLIDNAIVVIESIFQNREKGLCVSNAAITGTAEVTGAVVASTLTTIVVFLPIVYLHGAIGELFKDQAWTVTLSLISSLFVAIFVIPMCYKMMNRKAEKSENERIDKQTVEIKSIRITGYNRVLNNLLRHRLWVVLIAFLLIIASGLLLPFIGTEFMPHTEGKAFTILVKMPEGTRLERTSSAVDNLRELLVSLTNDPELIVYTHAGAGSGLNDAIFEGENTAMIKTLLSEQCTMPAETVIARFIETAGNTDGMELTVLQEENSLSAVIGNESAPLVIEIKGEELDKIAEITEEVKARVVGVNDLYNVTTSIEDGAPEISISINRTMAGINNLPVSTIIEQIRQQLSGREAGQMEYRGEMRDILIKLPDITLADLSNTVIRSGEKNFRLQEIADIVQTQAPKEIYHRNQSRISRVMANIDAGKSLDKAANEVRLAIKDLELPPNYSITVTGEEEKRQESMHSLLFALLLSIILVYMVMASQFESLLHPFTILLSIPLAVVGAVWLFFLTGKTVNMMGIIGVVMLVGIAVNNSILLVDRINQLKQTRSLNEAIVLAGQERIRPILMTSLTTILALLPLTFSIGESSSLRSPMAIAVVGGLITSTLMSLAVIPCVYCLLEEMKLKITRRKSTDKEA
ncbi:MAG: efflux RND transporter permease subunit [Dysgonamonadaceae bacterium]|jgi:HAE1 family hydrophobic/amphiphilic exporter-1|nr:efflux RND transporter permease subunit [Dysgonamonadaceae bacterium]